MLNKQKNGSAVGLFSDAIYNVWEFLDGFFEYCCFAHPSNLWYPVNWYFDI